MTDKEIIRKEIERRKEAIVDACGGCIVSQSNSIEYKVLCELAELIDFINSMKEEAVCTGIGEPNEESGVLGEMVKEIKENPKDHCEEPVSELLNIESMIESYEQRLISQANGVKNNPLVNMCLASYKHGINETLDTLNLSNFERTVKDRKEPKFKVGDRIKFKGVQNEDVTRVITNIQKGDRGGFLYFFADGSIYSIGDDGIELVEESVSDDLEKAAVNAFKQIVDSDKNNFLEIFKAGAEWQKKHLWKPAYGNELPEYEREVIAILDYDFGHYKVVYAHRPNPNGWNGTNIDTGEKEHFESEIYDKGGWNQPHVLYWLDTKLPYEEKKLIKKR